jgi:signal transduction histidine kinase/DNA-binding NarL/FixJ family response regulator
MIPCEPAVIVRAFYRHGCRSCLLAVLLAALACAEAASAPPPIILTDDEALPLQVERMELLRDPTRGLALADVRAPDMVRRFETAPPGIPNLGTGCDDVWVRFAVQNATGGPLSSLLALTDARTAQVAFWALDGAGQVIAQRRDGRFADPELRDRSHRWFVFDLPLATGATATVYLRITSDMGRRLDLRLTDRLRLAEADRTAYGLLALLMGGLLVMLAYNLLLLVQLRDPAYLWLCCFVAGIAIWIMDREGLLTTVTWWLWPASITGVLAGGGLAFAGLFLFPVAYLRLREHTPRLVWMHLGLAALGMSLPLLYAAAPRLGYTTGLLLGVVAAPTMILSGFLVLRRQRRSALWYLASWLPMLLATGLLMAMNYGLVPALRPVWVLPYIGVLLLLLLLSVAQADRVNELRCKAEDAKAALRRSEHRLSDLVDKRTRALAEARDRAEAASRAKTRFLASMSHDLRTPLSAVLGGADLLRRSPRLGAEEQDQCGLIQRAGRHLLRMIEDLLDIARIEHDRLRPLIGTLVLRPMLGDLAAATRRQAQAKGLDFDLRLGADLPERVGTDGRRLRQVLQNLLDNAVKYTEAGRVGLAAGIVPPSARPAADAGELPILWFMVTDTGHGIAEADRERLFAPFEQYHHAQSGSGLGLAICREITALLGGALTLESTPGRGSRFCLRLPVQPAGSASDAAGADLLGAPVMGYKGPRRRILIVDDSDVNRMLMAGMLGHLGFAVDVAADVEAALVIARSRPPDLLISDLRMPGTCGYAATWQLRRALGRPQLPAIAASASPLPAAGDAAELGFDAFLLKPIEQGELCTAIGGCLALSWVRADTVASARPPSAPGTERASDRPPIGPPARPAAQPPPSLELGAARELAARQDWVSLRDWCTELGYAFPECADFVRLVRSRLDEIDAGVDAQAASGALRQLLEDHG